MNKLVFVDVAAGYKGVHNTAFLESLCGIPVLERGRYTVVVHRSLCSKLEKKLINNNIAVIKHFTVNFYEFFDKKLNILNMQPYIFNLTQEYTSMFDILMAKNESKTHMIFHTMSWEHIQALALALKKNNNKEFDFFIYIFLMYWCGIGFDNDDNLILKNQYKIGISNILGDNIRLYTSNNEYKESYLSFLNRQIKIHPCFVGNWIANNNNKVKYIKKNILLYFGEVKESKGFYDLPNFFEILLDDVCFYEYRFIIQFSREKLNSRQELIYQSLIKIAKERDVDIDIIYNFLDGHELHNLFSKVDIIVLNYDKSIYANKTSGVLWLALQYNIICMVTKDTWLQRELDFMGFNYYLIDRSEVNFILKSEDYFKSKFSYRKEVFCSFLDWLNEIVLN